VFHLETSPGNIPWSLYQDIKNDHRVELAIPYATGDNYLGFRIVGTTTEIFMRVTRRVAGPRNAFQDNGKAGGRSALTLRLPCLRTG